MILRVLFLHRLHRLGKILFRVFGGQTRICVNLRNLWINPLLRLNLNLGLSLNLSLDLFSQSAILG